MSCRQGNQIMNTSKSTVPFKWFAAILLLAAAASTYAQGNNSQTPAANTNQTQNAPQPTPQNVPAALNFTPQQAEQWRNINREFRAQEIAATAKVRDARLALN